MVLRDLANTHYPRLSSLDFVRLSFASKHVFGHFRGDLPVSFSCEMKNTKMNGNKL